MGLVAPAPIDMLLTPTPAVHGKGGRAAAREAQASGDLFAALLASLTGDAAGGTQPGGIATAAAFPDVPLSGLKDDDEDDGAMSAALAALQLLPQLMPVLPGPLDGGQPTAPAVPPEAIAAAATDAVPEMEAAAEASAATGEAGEVAPPDTSIGQPATGAPVQATPAATVQPAPVNAAEATPAGPVADVIESMGIEVSATAKLRREERKSAHDAAESAASTAPPGAPPDAQAIADSVVRFAGNADNNGRRNGQQETTPKEGNEPNASVQGIAHAAANSAVGELRTQATSAPDATADPAPAAPTMPEAVTHVGRTIIENVEQGGGEARLHLRPEALGEVTLHIHTDGAQVRVEVHAERAEAASLLRDHTQDLSQLLGERGLNLTDVHVDLGWQGPQNQRGDEPGWARPRQAENSGFAKLMGIDEPSPTDRYNRLRSAYNPDGAHSYRV